MSSIKKCFECETFGPVEMHHVVPECLGGTKTVPLCYNCNSKVHALKNLNTGELSRHVKNQRKKLGFSVDGPKYGYDIIEGKYIENQEEQKIVSLVQDLRESKTCLVDIIAILNERNIKKRGVVWTQHNIKSLL